MKLPHNQSTPQWSLCIQQTEQNQTYIRIWVQLFLDAWHFNNWWFNYRIVYITHICQQVSYALRPSVPNLPTYKSEILSRGYLWLGNGNQLYQSYLFHSPLFSHPPTRFNGHIESNVNKYWISLHINVLILFHTPITIARSYNIRLYQFLRPHYSI